MPIIGKETCSWCGGLKNPWLVHGSDPCHAKLCPRVKEDTRRLREHIAKLEKEIAAWREFAPLGAFDGNVIVMPG